eukprot:s2057_g2.t1
MEHAFQDLQKVARQTMTPPESAIHPDFIVAAIPVCWMTCLWLRSLPATRTSWIASEHFTHIDIPIS